MASTRFAWVRTFAALVLVAAPSFATWSIVVVDTRTHEVCIAGATCLSNVNLKKLLPVMRVGIGGACAQAQGDTAGTNRAIIWNGLGDEISPQAILDLLALQPQHQTRQYGIVNLADDPVTFSGAFTAEANPGVVGIAGDLRYAIQGNILAGDEVVLFAESKLLSAPGDLGQRVLAAMEEARYWGGDGRCSCNPNAPTSCQPLPPPTPFLSAYVSFFVLGRIGDTGGAQCNASVGCAAGQLYCALNVIGDGNDPDPVITLQQEYAAWRSALAGRPDQVLTRVSAGAQSLVADHTTKTKVTVRLFDVEGVPLAQGGHSLALTNLSGAPAVTTASAITDHGDGSYSFTLKAGDRAGEDLWRIVVTDAGGPVTLYPYLAMRVDPLAPLHAGFDQISAADPHSVPLVVNAGVSSARRPYLLLATTAGTVPGLPFAGTQLPLNSSSLLTATYLNANSSWLPGSFGKLDRHGRAEAAFAPDPSLLAQLAGTHLDWSGILFAPLGSTALPPVGVDVTP